MGRQAAIVLYVLALVVVGGCPVLQKPILGTADVDGASE